MRREPPRTSLSACACGGQLLPPPRDGIAFPCGLERVPHQVGSGLIRTEQLLRPLRLLERIFDGRPGMVLASSESQESKTG